MGLKIGVPNYDAGIRCVQSWRVWRVQTIQCIESIIDRVVNLFTHLRSLHGQVFEGPILGLFLSPFLRGPKMGQNWSRRKFCMGWKVIDVVVWYTNNDNVLMMLSSQHTRSVGKREKWGRGPKKNRLAKYRRSGDSGGSRRRSQNVEGGPKQRFDVSP